MTCVVAAFRSPTDVHIVSGLEFGKLHIEGLSKDQFFGIVKSWVIVGVAFVHVNLGGCAGNRGLRKEL